ncbi:contact-dependent growth inhibition system immunity protein [Nocardioides sp.]|uniref:contact-dependent growth inhibition system immunity protein n=1 Tax=Nocardioides sp. TaxID=35761 RepID=UPI002D807340|nr:contact-dependent growth inhibition system immunity protein [Nocardioides sp.]HET8960686.1 contact-dependent growth inhibition system immunity protein [Nocardioides sp.]
MTDFPALKRLSGAYVNEDWPDFYDDVWAAVDDFISGAPTLARQLPSEVNLVLHEQRSEGSLERFLDSLGLGYQPQPGDSGFSGFLTEVARRASVQAHAT